MSALVPADFGPVRVALHYEYRFVADRGRDAFLDRAVAAAVGDRNMYPRADGQEGCGGLRRRHVSILWLNVGALQSAREEQRAASQAFAA